MNAEWFDSVTRRVAKAQSRRETRRTVLGGLGLAAPALFATRDSSNAGPTAGPAGASAVRQATADSLIDELAFALEYDLEQIYRFVADEIAYQPYDGALRGALGTLWSGAGNSVDQAQLLKALLDAAMIPAEFVEGPLAADAADELYSATVAASRMPRRVEEQLIADIVNRQPGPDATPVVTPADVAENQARIEQLRAELFEHYAGQIAADAELFAGLLADAGVLAQSQPTLGLPEGERNRHTWLRAPFGADTVDLDPTFSGGQVGDLYAEGGSLFEELADDRYHTVRIQLTVDSRSGAEVVNQPIIDQTFRSQELVGEDIAITHIDPESLQAIGMALQEALEGTVSWYAVLATGKESFLSDGVLRFGSGGGVLGTIFDAGEVGTVAEGETLAEYIEIEVTSPGHGASRTARTVFDRLADQRSRDTFDFEAVAPAAITEIGDGESGFLPIKQVFAIAAISSHVPDQFLAAPLPDSALFEMFGGSVHALHAVRQRLQVASPAVGGFFPDRPNVSALMVAPIPNETGGVPGVQLFADLMVQGFRGGADAASTAGIVAGLTAQAAEEVLLHNSMMDVMFDLGIFPVLPELAPDSAGAIFRVAAESGIELAVLRPGDVDGLAALGLADHLAARIAGHLEADRAVIVPQRPAPVGDTAVIAWWIFDPETGDFWDELPDGRGGARALYGPMGEYAIQLWNYTRTVKGFFVLGACIFALMREVGSMMALGPDTTAGGWISYGGNVGGAAVTCGGYAGML